MMLVTVKFMCYLMWCLKKQTTTVFSHLDISFSEKFPLNLHLRYQSSTHFLNDGSFLLFSLGLGLGKDVSITKFVTIK